MPPNCFTLHLDPLPFAFSFSSAICFGPSHPFSNFPLLRDIKVRYAMLLVWFPDIPIMFDLGFVCFVCRKKLRFAKPHSRFCFTVELIANTILVMFGFAEMVLNLGWGHSWPTPAGSWVSDHAVCPLGIPHRLFEQNNIQDIQGRL